MRRERPYVLASLALCLLLAACGQTTGSDSAPGSSGPIHVSVGSSTFHRSDAISVTIANQGSNDIYAADHQSQCTIVQVQMRSGTVWQTIDKCAVMTPTRMHLVGHGTSQTVTLAAPHGGWPAGGYRAALFYSQNASPSGSMSLAYSAEFQVSG
jgi:hypothetical protein